MESRRSAAVYIMDTPAPVVEAEYQASCEKQSPLLPIVREEPEVCKKLSVARKLAQQVSDNAD